MSNSSNCRLVAAVVAMLLVPAAAQAGALTGQCISRIAVDSRELRDKGGVGAADILDLQLPKELREIFADRVGCRVGVTLRVRLQTISLPPIADGSFDAFGPQDSLKGESELLDRGGRVIASYPLNARLRSGYSGWGNDPDQAGLRLRRLQALAGAFAGWLRVHYVGS